MSGKTLTADRIAEIKARAIDFSDIQELTEADFSRGHFRNKVEVKPKHPKRSFGMANGELRYPDDIDFCNDEIAAMFGVDAFRRKG